MENNQQKTGLQAAAEKTPSATSITAPAGEIEKDADELVHERKDELPDVEATEQDIDDLMHTQSEIISANELEESDADDLIHQDENNTAEEDR